MSDSGEGGNDQPQRFGVWVESDDYEWAKPYDDGDINFSVTQEQAEQIIEKFQRCFDSATDQREVADP